jgi:hypothetical protein
VRDTTRPWSETVIGFRLEKGNVQTRARQRTGTTYTFRNRSKKDRSLLVEHPRTAEWTLTDTDKPAEATRHLYRFAWTVAAGKTLRRTVTEEKVSTSIGEIEKSDTPYLREIMKAPAMSKKVREALEKVIERRGKLESANRAAAEVSAVVRDGRAEQTRLRDNLARLPQGSAAHKRSLEKFDRLEVQLEKVQAEQDEKRAVAERLRKEYQTFLSALCVE